MVYCYPNKLMKRWLTVDERLLAKLEGLGVQQAELERQMAEAAGSDPTKLAELGRRHAELREVLGLYQQWQRAEQDWLEAKELSDQDTDLASELQEMAAEQKAEADRLELELRQALTPTHPDNNKDAIIEIRAAAGGDEASLWTADLLRMYEKYAQQLGFTVEPLASVPSEAGGWSRVTVAVHGHQVFGKFKYEAGVHRVQRIPKTESSGRIHTSTATVAVLPEVGEVEVVIDQAEVRMEVFRSSGPGGQSVNTTDSAVRLTHLPTGMVVSCQDEKSQLQNRAKAYRILRARLYQLEEERQNLERKEDRRAQVGTGERSEKIRTYNFKENRVTDHRLGLTLKQLDRILEGGLEEFVEALVIDEQTKQLASTDPIGG